MKRISLLLCLLTVLVFIGCGTQDEQSGNTTASFSEEAMESTQIMAADHEEVPEDYSTFENMTLVGNTLYYSTLDWNFEERLGTWEIYRKNENEEEFLITEIVEGQELLCFTPDREGNLYLLYQESNASQNIEDETIHFRKLNANGEEVFTSSADWILPILENDHICNLEVNPEGQVCALTIEGTLLLWNEKGEEIGSVFTNWAKNEIISAHMGLVNGGSYGIYGYLCENGQLTFSKIDFETGKPKEPFSVPLAEQTAAQSFYEQAVWVYSNYENGIFLADKTSMRLYDFETGQVEELFFWVDEYINMSPDFVEQVVEDEDGGYTLLAYDADTNTSSQVHIEQKQKDELPDKITITLGGFIRNLDDTLEEQIGRFNRSQEEYRLEVVRYNSPSDLNFMLLKGVGPDIIFLENLSVENLSSKGILEDLTPYIESSPSLSGNILESIQEVCTLDGGIRYLFPYFVLEVLVLEQGHTDENGVIAPMDFLHLTDQRSDSYLFNMGNSLSYQSLLRVILATEMNSYVDWENRVCHFNDGRFGDLLEAVKAQKMPTGEFGKMPESTLPVVQRFVNREFLSIKYSISNMSDYIYLEDAFGEYGEITGFPNSSGSLQYPTNVSLRLGVNSASDQKQAAWAFIEYLLLNAVNPEDYMSPFSVVEDMFIQQLSPQPQKNWQYNLTNPHTGELIKGVEMGDFFTITEEQQKVVKEMADNASNPPWISDTVRSIIQEEADYFFEGDKSAKEVCDIIQNRVSLLLAE